LFVGVWTARYLGPAGYGMLNYAVAFVSLFGALATLGLDQIVVRELVHAPQDEGKLVGTSFFLKLIGGFVVLFLSTIVAMILHHGDVRTILMIFFVSLGMVAQAFLAIDFFFQSKILSKYTVIAQNIAFFAVSIIKVILILTGQAVEWFAGMSLIEALVAGVFLVFFYNRKGGHISNWKFDSDVAKKLLRDSWPLILSSVAIMIYMRIDQVMIRNMLGEKEVGWYSAAVSLSEVWYFIPGIITASVFPTILEAKKIGEKLYYLRLNQLLVVLFFISLLTVLFVNILSKNIVYFLFGKHYDKAIEIWNIYIWAAIFVFQGVARSYWVVSENLQVYTNLYVVAGMLVNIVGNFLLIKKIGYLGAAYSTLFSQGMVTLVIPLLIKKMQRFTFLIWKLPLSLFCILTSFLKGRYFEK
ncbi:MAG: flippase, partial [Brevinematales bacterium]|nr:flippase [Brevinematales bacterium]